MYKTYFNFEWDYAEFRKLVIRLRRIPYTLQDHLVFEFKVIHTRLVPVGLCNKTIVLWKFKNRCE